MGVKGLWTVLEPAGEPLPHAGRLGGHRLAVDASIWLYQLTKALPQAEQASTGAAGYNPLVLAGLLRRVCKLLHFGIRPVFVFDGGVPLLKASTVRERRSRRAEAESRYKRLAKKMLRMRMALLALGGDAAAGADTAAGAGADAGQAADEPAEDPWDSYSSSELGELDQDQLDGLDIESSDFKALPLDLKQELLLGLGERAKAARARAPALPADALDFSKTQIESVVKRRKIFEELERMSRSGFGSYGREGGPRAYRLAGSSKREFVMVKGDAGGWTFAPKDAAPSGPAPAAPAAEPASADDDFERQFFGEDCAAPPPAPVITLRPAPPTERPAAKPAPQPAYLDVESESSDEPTVYQDDRLDDLPAYGDIHPEDDGPAGERPVGEQPAGGQPAGEQPALAPHGTLVPAKEPPPAAQAAGPPAEARVERREPAAADFYLADDDEEAFLEEFGYASGADIARRVAAAQQESRAAQNEAGALGNELLYDFQQLLNLFGLPWLGAPMEAEAQCAYLQACGLVDGIVTDDSDVLLFADDAAGLLVYRNFFKDGRPALVYGTPRIRFQLGLSRADLVVLAFLCGGDYGVGVRGVGPKRGLELVRTLQRTQTLLRCDRADEAAYARTMLTMIKRLVDDFDAIGAELALPDQKALQKVLGQIHHLDADFPREDILQAYLCPEVSTDSRPFAWLTPNAPGLERFLEGRLGWPLPKIRQVIGPILRRALGDHSG